MWKKFDDFQESSELQQEAVESVIKGSSNMYAIDAKDISFQVKKTPMNWVVEDSLLSEYQNFSYQRLFCKSMRH